MNAPLSITFNKYQVTTCLQWLACCVLLILSINCYAQPSINSIAPTKGIPGNSVILTGANFNAVPGNNTVWFGATQATITGGNTNSLTVTVPLGATYAPISVLNTATHLSANSNISFLPTYTPSKGSISVSDFTDQRFFGTSDGPTAIAISDVDGDGKPDIAVATTISNTVSIRLNTGSTGNLTFAAKIDFSVGRTPYGIVAADVDGDGKPDIITANANSNTVSVLRNTSTPGSVSFSRVDLPTGQYPNAVVVADFDGDGRPDIAALNDNDNTVSILHNTGTPGNISFDAKQDYRVGYIPSAMVTGDIDGDGKADIATLNFSGSVSVLRNIGNPGNPIFANRVDFNAESGNRSITIGDMDGDGKNDLAIPSNYNSTVTIMRNTSSSGNVSFAPRSSFTSGPSGFAIAAGDIDGDGKPDLATANWTAPSANRVSVIRNNSSTGSLNFDPNIALSSGRGPFGVAVGDLDGNGKPDIVIADNSDGGVSIFMNNPKQPPTIQATNIVFTETTSTSTKISWTNGNGSSRVVFIKAATSGSPSPADGTTYAPAPVFKTGSQINTSGWYAVYNGTGNNVIVTGLAPGTIYQVMVNEYLGTPSNEIYLNTSANGNPGAFLTVSDDATLANLQLIPSFLFLPFAPGTLNYTVNVSNTVDGIVIQPTVNVSSATVTVNGNPVISGNLSTNIPLNTGANTIKIVVTAPDGVTTKTYTVNVIRAAASDASLISLAPSAGTLSPVFATTITNYTVNVPNATTGITLTPTATDQNVAIYINGSTVPSGTASPNIPLSIGNNNITTKVTAPDGITTKTYTVNVIRAAASDASLISLVPSAGTLSPVFATAVTNYTVNVPNATTGITLTPTATDPDVAISINGSTVPSGTASPNIPLSIGNNNITTKVTAPDGVTTKTYTVNVIRAAASDASLISLVPGSGTLSPVFATTITNYTVNVSNTTTGITLTPTATDPSALIFINGNLVPSGTISQNIPLNVGNNTINTKVTAPDGVTSKMYTVNIIRAAAASDASLISLVPGSGTLSPVFATTITNYTVNVSNTTTGITLTPTATDPSALIFVNGNLISSGTISQNIPLNIGNNTINTKVTAPDGVTSKMYTVNVIRAAAASDASLISLVPSAGTLDPVFNSDTKNYDLPVSGNISNISLTPTANTGSTVTVNGMAVLSGSSSVNIPLNVGHNIIAIKVVAADDITDATYIVNVNRLTDEQLITFNPLSEKSLCAVDFSAGVNSTNSDNPITYFSSNSAVATVSAQGIIHIVGAGTTTITANQEAFDHYNAAEPKTQLLSVINPAVPDVTISADQTTFCPATPVKLTASVGGNNTDHLLYQWQLNGINSGDDSPTIIVYPTDESVIYQCKVTNVTQCNVTGASNSLQLILTPTVTPSVTIANINSEPVCASTPITFLATATNGGNQPLYQWQVNGEPGGTNSKEFSSTTLNNGDVVQCLITNTDGGCNTPLPASSNTITLNITPNATTPEVTITASSNPAKTGTPVIFKATTTIAISQQSYQWLVNSVDANQNGSVFYISSLKDGDIVGCIVHNYGDCSIPAISNQITMKILPDVIAAIPSAFSPNGDGVNDYWVLNGLGDYNNIHVRIYDRTGAIVYEAKNYAGNWNGNRNGLPLPTSTYYYLIDLHNGTKPLSGPVTIIR